MTQDQMLDRSYLAIEGVRSNPERAKVLKQVGWSPQDTTQGWKLYQAAYDSYTDRKDKMSQQRSATDALREAEANLDSLYKKHLSLIRLAAPYDRDVSVTLELEGTREKERSAWFAQIRNFYKNIFRVEAELASYKITSEEIAQAQAMIDAVSAARVKQNNARGAAQEARVTRDEAYQELNDWMRKFVRTARFAFNENRQQLEALGIIAK